jgi:glutaredoxin
VPQIFLGGGKVGGFSDLEGMDKDGKLDEALKTAGAL